MDSTRNVLGMLHVAPLPAPLLNLQQGLMFDPLPLRPAHHLLGAAVPGGQLLAGAMLSLP